MISRQLLWAVVAGVALGAVPADVRADAAWLQVAEPAEALQIRGALALVPVRGSAGAGLDRGHDVLIALDRSLSVWEPSGSDVDGDGQIGRTRPGVDLFTDYQRICTDPGDTILQAELRAARLLIEGFDPRTTRMGLLSFDGGASVHAPIGSSRAELLHALDTIAGQARSSGTSFDVAFKLALAQFKGLRSRQPRTRSVILLSDGRPTQPSPIEHARQFAVVSALDLAREGVRIFAFALRPQRGADPESGLDDVYRQVAQVSGGALFLADRPADVIEIAPHLPLARIERVQIENLSARQPARALRLLPDGSFDAFAPLVPGTNVLRIVAVSERGEVSAEHRRVYFEPAQASTPEEIARMQAMLQELKMRSLQADLASAARKRLHKPRGERRLVIESVDSKRGSPRR